MECERRPGEVVSLPRGVTASEASLLLRLFVRLKERRFGRLTVAVSDGRLMDIELTEKVDRALFRGDISG